MKVEGVELLIVFFTIIILLVIVIMAFLYVTFIRKRTQILLRKREKEISFKQELALSQIEIREQTLTDIGRELHDDIGQKLSVAKLLNNQLLFSLDEDNKTCCEEINTVLGECINDIRGLSKTFITDQVERFGLMNSLEREIARISKLEYLNVTTSFNTSDIEMNNNHSIILFRIFQECINNVLKHSKATTMRITINNFEQSLYLTIQDNGIGIEESKIKDGVGISNMKKRAEIINAEIAIQTSKEGTEVKIIYNKE